MATADTSTRKKEENADGAREPLGPGTYAPMPGRAPEGSTHAPLPGKVSHQTSKIEDYAIELSPVTVPGLSIRLALQINPSQIADASATPSSSTMSPDDIREFKPLTPRASEIVLADLDLFFSENPSWGEISLLKAGGQDHRLIARIKAGESFRTSTVDDLYATMNKAARGDLKPDAFRNTVARKSAAAATAAKAAASGSTRKDAKHGTKRKPARR